MNTRVAVLQAVFTEIAETRMAGLPIHNPALGVEALGFEPLRHADALASGLVPAGAPRADRLWEPPLAIGVLLTPWCMNLVSLPLPRDDCASGVGQARLLSLGGHQLSFINAHEPTLGRFFACSLFSPMWDFASAAAARATAMAVLDDLRGRNVAARDGANVSASASASTSAIASAIAGVAAQAMPAQAGVPSRRGFLFGRPGSDRATA